MSKEMLKKIDKYLLITVIITIYNSQIKCLRSITNLGITYNKQAISIVAWKRRIIIIILKM